VADGRRVLGGDHDASRTDTAVFRPGSCRSVNCNDVQTDAGCTTLLRAAPLPEGNRRLPPEKAARVRLRKSRSPPRLTAGRTTPLALQQGRRRASVRGRRAATLPPMTTARFLTIDQVAEELATSRAPRSTPFLPRRDIGGFTIGGRGPWRAWNGQSTRSTSSEPTPRPTPDPTRTPTS